MNDRKDVLKELSRGISLETQKGLIGFDGFVDKIIFLVDKRLGAHFDRIKTMADFAKRIQSAAGKSTNIEGVVHEERLGGNGPIFANALLNLGLQVRYIGALGVPIGEIFRDFAQKTQAVSLCEPGVTNALEFDDGKLLLGIMSHFDTITMETIVNTVGDSDLNHLLKDVSLIAFQNWTMIPHMTAILDAFKKRLLDIHLDNRRQRLFFFDLADPEKRSGGDVKAVLETIQSYARANFGKTILSLNLKEAQFVGNILGVKVLGGKIQSADERNSLLQVAQEIRNYLQVSYLVIHPLDCAVCATEQEVCFVEGFYTPKPLITTGGGDHFNGGFAGALLADFSLKTALTFGIALSGLFVRTGKTPSFSDVALFIKSATME